MKTKWRQMKNEKRLENANTIAVSVNLTAIQFCGLEERKRKKRVKASNSTHLPID
jgi:hypothetical protein